MLQNADATDTNPHGNETMIDKPALLSSAMAVTAYICVIACAATTFVVVYTGEGYGVFAMFVLFASLFQFFADSALKWLRDHG